MKTNNQCNIKIKERSNFYYWNKKVIKTGGELGRRPFKFKLPTPRLRHSFIDKFLLGSREKLMLINTASTIRETNHGLLLAAKILRHQGKLLIVDTRPDVSPFLEIIENGFHTIPSVISFSGSRWVGGTVSNWKIISKKVSHYGHISRQLDDFLSQNEIQISGYRKMKVSYPGFLENHKGNMALKLKKKKPDLIFVVNPNESRHIIQEANGLKIPVIALVDSNTNLDGIKISIPVNYDTMFWVYHCVNTLIRLAGSLQIYDKRGFTSVQSFKESRPFRLAKREASKASPSSPLKEGTKNHKIRKDRIISGFKESKPLSKPFRHLERGKKKEDRKGYNNKIFQRESRYHQKKKSKS